MHVETPNLGVSTKNIDKVVNKWYYLTTMLSQKIQITLTPEEVAALTLKGKALGYNVTKYIKFIVSNEVYKIIKEYPPYKMPVSMENKKN